MYRILCVFAVASGVVAFTTFDFDFTSLDIERDEDVGDPVFIDVAQGRLMGHVKSHHNVSFHLFGRIPYAKPPLGQRRFKDPEPADPWEGVLNATHLPPACPQRYFVGEEDCLFLNVFTPVDSLNQSEALPVMVFIHGGAFVLGGSRSYLGAQPFVQQNVILVTLNYRLGVLGFLSTEDSAAPGNQGLKDQTLALQWVKDNIAAFGGDPQRVTIFGESAGAASVHYQILSPYAAGLFSGAILQSGSAYSPWGRGRDFFRVAQEVGTRFGCPIDVTDDMISCLQEQDADLIREAYYEFPEWGFHPIFFGPRIDGDYIPDEPATLVKEGRYSHVPLMMGINEHEGALVSGAMYSGTELIDALVENFTSVAQASLELLDDEEPLTTATQVYDYYLGGLNFEYENADIVTKLYSHRHFMVPMDWLAQMTADVDTVYTWELLYRGTHSILEFYIGLNDSLSEHWICHADELQYQFSPFIFLDFEDTDIIVSDLYATMWTNFAKSRNPTPDDSLGFIWETTTSLDLRHLAITSDLPLTMESDKRTVERVFWESLPLRINSLMRP